MLTYTEVHVSRNWIHRSGEGFHVTRCWTHEMLTHTEIHVSRNWIHRSGEGFHVTRYWTH